MNDEHRHKILNKTGANQIQQYIRRTTQHDQVGFIQVMQEFFNIHKSIDLNRCREALEKSPTSICDKTLQKVGIEGPYLNIKKATFDKPTDNIILDGKEKTAFLLRSGRREGWPLSPLLFNIVTEVLTTAIREEKEIKESKLEKK